MAKTLCPVRILLDQFSDRWAVLAILSLKEGPVRFNALRRNLDGITQKVLGQTLQRLAQNGLVDRNVLATKPVAVEYKLSELGMSLRLCSSRSGDGHSSTKHHFCPLDKNMQYRSLREWLSGPESFTFHIRSVETCLRSAPGPATLTHG